MNGAFGLLARSLPLWLETALAPSRSRPLALTENCCWRTPANQKSKPIGERTDTPSSELAPIRATAPDIDSSVAPVPTVNGYVEAVIDWPNDGVAIDSHARA